MSARKAHLTMVQKKTSMEVFGYPMAFEVSSAGDFHHTSVSLA
jgi:hypothetical protein